MVNGKPDWIFAYIELNIYAYTWQSADTSAG